MFMLSYMYETEDKGGGAGKQGEGFFVAETGYGES